MIILVSRTPPNRNLPPLYSLSSSVVVIVSIVLSAAAEAAISIATPVPEPTPVAVNNTPTVLAIAPIAVKSVVPILLIVYCFVATKEPAVMLYAVSIPSNDTPVVARVER